MKYLHTYTLCDSKPDEEIIIVMDHMVDAQPLYHHVQGKNKPIGTHIDMPKGLNYSVTTMFGELMNSIKEI